MSIPTEDQEDAGALLATVRHLMTGTEIDLCERIVSGECRGGEILPRRDLDDDGDEVDFIDPEMCGCYATPAEQPLFDSLKIQFYAQTSNYKDREVSR
ncbi:hypothetical protein HQ447_19090 [bacterium]|nr:hypothetical protein [bacterium]